MSFEILTAIILVMSGPVNKDKPLEVLSFRISSLLIHCPLRFYYLWTCHFPFLRFCRSLDSYEDIALRISILFLLNLDLIILVLRFISVIFSLRFQISWKNVTCEESCCLGCNGWWDSVNLYEEEIYSRKKGIVDLICSGRQTFYLWANYQLSPSSSYNQLITVRSLVY